MKFLLDKVDKKSSTTFSAEAVLGFMMSFNGFVEKTLASIMADGFESNKIVNRIEFNIDFIVNGEPFSDDKIQEIISSYPNIIGFSSESLLETIKQNINKENGR